MQYVNDDMDNLFRRAAENYPLDTSGADWSKVAAALQNADDATSYVDKGKSNRRLLWLLLLLPLGLLCNQLYTPVVEVDSGRITGSEKNKNSIEKFQNFGINQSIPASSLQNDLTSKQRQTNNKVDGQQAIGENDFVNRNSSFSTKQKSSFTTKQNKEIGKGTDYNSSIYQEESNASLVKNEAVDEGDHLQRKYISYITRDKTDKSEIEINRPLTPVENPNKKKRISSKDSKGFYFGLMGSMDFTTVKFEKFQQKGFTLGILAGYQLSDNWSIETGIFKENKYYYSDGKYFNTSKIPVYANSKITEVSGECNMYEVPLNVKYNFSSGKKTWFVTAGSSSYIMQKEDYTYSYYYGVYGPYSKRSQYYNSSRNLFATANISGGYSRKIGNGVHLRVEPYIKLPLSGMGIGKLPLISTGITVGITKKF